MPLLPLLLCKIAFDVCIASSGAKALALKAGTQPELAPHVLLLRGRFDRAAVAQPHHPLLFSWFVAVDINNKQKNINVWCGGVKCRS
jgi:hypothetical protein